MREIAQEHSIYGFCYYHYWFVNRKVMYKPTELMLLDGEPNMPFFFSWANEPWTRRWDGGNGDVLLAQNYGNDNDNIEHFYYLLPFFRHPNYIKIQGKPLFSFYRIDPEHQLSIEGIISLWNDLAIKHGLPGLYILKTLGSFTSSNNIKSPLVNGLIEFHPLYLGTLGVDMSRRDTSNSIFQIVNGVPLFDEETYLRHNPDIKDAITKGIIPSGIAHYEMIPPPERSQRTHRTQQINKSTLYDSKKTYDGIIKLRRQHPVQFRGTFVGWNNTPRKPNSGIVFKDIIPFLFQNHLIALIKKVIADPNAEENFIFINAWNEWNEQAILEPSNLDGYEYLRVIRRVLDFFS